MNGAPDISVVIPVYNCKTYISDCLDSVLSQTCKPDEIIVVDDDSTDGTYELLHGYSLKHREVSLVKLDQKKGNERRTARALNTGITLARGKYIALMDADDWCGPQRLQVQKSYLDANQDVIAVGSQVKIAGKTGKIKGVLNRPEADPDLQMQLIWRSPFFQNTVMMRREVLLTNQLRYDESFAFAEDYEFFTRLARYGKLHNLPEALVTYRMHEEQSVKHEQFSGFLKPAVCREVKLALQVDDQTSERFWEFVNHRNGLAPGELRGLTTFRTVLLKQNRAVQALPEKPFAALLEQILFQRIITRKSYHPLMIFGLIGRISPVRLLNEPGQTIVFVIKCLLFRKQRF